MAFGVVVFQLIPGQLLGLFDASEQMLQIGIPALRIISIHFVLAAFGIVCGSVFQALGNAVYSMIVSLTRQLIVLLPAAYLLAQTGDVTKVWWAFPIAEMVSVTVSAIFLIQTNRKIIQKI